MHMFVLQDGRILNLYQACEITITDDKVLIAMSNQHIYHLSGIDAERFKTVISQVTNYDMVTKQ